MGKTRIKKKTLLDIFRLTVNNCCSDFIHDEELINNGKTYGFDEKYVMSIKRQLIQINHLEKTNIPTITKIISKIPLALTNTKIIALLKKTKYTR